MKEITIERKDSAGGTVIEKVRRLEKQDYGTAIDGIALDFQTSFKKLINMGLPVERFMFVFRAEKAQDGSILFDRFFIDQDAPHPETQDTMELILAAMNGNDLTTTEISKLTGLPGHFISACLRRHGYKMAYSKEEFGIIRGRWVKIEEASNGE